MLKNPFQANARTGEGGGPDAKTMRRAVGRERHYQCSDCGFERLSRVALRSCPSCGSDLARATVVRTLLA